MASKSDSEAEKNIGTKEELSSSELVSSAQDKVGAFIADVTGRTRTRAVKPFKKCKSATFKVDGTCFTIGKSFYVIDLFVCVPSDLIS